MRSFTGVSPLVQRLSGTLPPLSLRGRVRPAAKRAERSNACGTKAGGGRLDLQQDFADMAGFAHIFMGLACLVPGKNPVYHGADLGADQGPDFAPDSVANSLFLFGSTSSQPGSRQSQILDKSGQEIHFRLEAVLVGDVDDAAPQGGCFDIALDVIATD